MPFYSIRRVRRYVQSLRFFTLTTDRRGLSKASRESPAPSDAYTSRADICSRSSCCRDYSTGTYTWALCRTRTCNDRAWCPVGRNRCCNWDSGTCRYPNCIVCPVSYSHTSSGAWDEAPREACHLQKIVPRSTSSLARNASRGHPVRGWTHQDSMQKEYSREEK